MVLSTSVLKEMLGELRAMKEAEQNVFFSQGSVILPLKMLAAMNSAILETMVRLLTQLLELNEGEFAHFVEMYPRLWGRLAVDDSFVTSRPARPGDVVYSPYHVAMSHVEDMITKSVMGQGPDAEDWEAFDKGSPAMPGGDWYKKEE